MGLVRTLDRWGAVAKQPLLWAVVAAGLFASGGRSRRAAKRGTACYLTGSVVGNGLKLLFKRPQPRHKFARRPFVSRSAFPSGHGAAEVAFAFAVGQEAPLLFLPVAGMAMLAHWALVREGKHYVSDMLAGGTIGLGIVVAAAKLHAAGSGGGQTEPDE